MQYLYHKIWIGCLVLQVAVDATVDVFTPVHQFESVTNAIVATFSNRDATTIDSSVEGELEYAAPPDACAPIAHPFFVATSAFKNMVLINGSSKCDFMTKVKNARAVGFEAAILFDPFPEPFNYSDIIFPIERSEINITVALVSCEDGIKLQKYLFPESRKKHLFVDIHPTSSSETYVVYLLLFVWVVLPLGLAVLIFVATFGKRLKKNLADSGVQMPVSGESESTPLVTSDSSATNNCLHSTEELKNELVEALGSVNNVQENESKKEDTQALIV